MKQAAQRVAAPDLLNRLPLLFASQLRDMLDCVSALKVTSSVVAYWTWMMGAFQDTQFNEDEPVSIERAIAVAIDRGQPGVVEMLVDDSVDLNRMWVSCCSCRWVIGAD